MEDYPALVPELEKLIKSLENILDSDETEEVPRIMLLMLYRTLAEARMYILELENRKLKESDNAKGNN